jgi:peptide/nickel transport system substrate-binding protein
MSNEKYIPNALKGLVSSEYVLKRYQSSIDWINTHHNAVIGNGPYYLQTFNPAGGVVTLNAFRDNTYPFRTGAYSDFKNPPELRIDTINVPRFLKIGDPYNFDLRVDANNQSNGSNSFSGIIDYFISDRNNKIVIEGSYIVNNTSNNQSESKVQSKLDESRIVAVSLNASQTQELIPGPAKMKLIITTKESPKPLIQELTLIARP